MQQSEQTENNTLQESIEKQVFHDCLSMIRWSPLVRINKLGKDLECELWAKCEYMLPGGSVKDRIGKQMLLDAEASGRIKPGDTLIEPTSGNTGIGLSLAAAIKGYNMIITLPQKMSQEKVATLQGLGAKVIRTPTEAAWDAPESHIGVAKKLLNEIPNSHILDQYGNPSNPNAHYENTAEELIQQCDGKIDMVVISAGTGGTITGIAKKFKERLPHCKIVGVDPVGSILAGPGPITPYHVEGIGYDFIPDVLDTSLVDKWVKTEDKESFVIARRMIREEGILCGGSSGSIMYAALQEAKELKKGQRCVVIVCDSVRNYLTKFLDDRWMIDFGFYDAPAHPLLGEKTIGQLDLPTPAVLPSTATCKEVLSFMDQQGQSFAPLVSEEKGLEAVVDEASLLAYLQAEGSGIEDAAFSARVAEFRELDPSVPLTRARFSLARQSPCFVVEKKESKKILKAVLTRRDLLHVLAPSSN
ncbi:Cystathionine beta-synthase [Balamuthia mandrillaris]